MRPPTRVLLLILIALGTAVAVLNARIVAISRTRPIVLPLTAHERIPHTTEGVELEKPPIATRSSAAGVTERQAGFELRFVSASEIMDQSAVGRREFVSIMRIDPEFRVLRPRTDAVSRDLDQEADGASR